MKKLTMGIFAALLLAAWASAQQADSQQLVSDAVQIAPGQVQEQSVPEDAEQQPVSSLTFEAGWQAPDGSSGLLQSRVAQPVVLQADRLPEPDAAQDTAQPPCAMTDRLFEAGVWDLLPVDSTVTLTLPQHVLRQATVHFMAADGSDMTPFAVQSLALVPAADGTVHACTFPVSFARPEDGAPCQRLYCTVTVTLENGETHEIGLALIRAA